MKVFILCALFIGLVAAQGRDNRCPLNDNSRIPTHLAHPTDCGSFMKCHNGNTYEMRCPGNLHWSVASNACESPALARCTLVNQRPQPQQPRPDPPRINPPRPNPPAPELDHPAYLNCPMYDTPGRFVYYPYHLNCSQFYQCVNGRAIL